MRIAVAMSGGVDSLRTAVILREQGHDVFGVHMRSMPGSQTGRWSAEAMSTSREDLLRGLASRFGIPVTVTDLRESFESCVIRPFLDAYLRGLTPNPCVWCNPRVKFGHLLKEAFALGADRFATGHYARIAPPDSTSSRFRLLRARDHSKDQSYFLYGLSRHQLETAVFPLGETCKKEVFTWAENVGIGSLFPGESQEICFIPAGEYHEFLRERLSADCLPQKGPIVDQDGKTLGEHKGIFAYTVGQRRGLGIPSSTPYYVVRLEPRSNTVHVGRARDLYRSSFAVGDINWASIPCPSQPFRCRVRIRHHHEPAPALVSPHEDGSAAVSFEVPQRAVTPGQSAVFYDGEMVLGGGIILD